MANIADRSEQWLKDNFAELSETDIYQKVRSIMDAKAKWGLTTIKQIEFLEYATALTSDDVLRENEKNDLLFDFLSSISLCAGLSQKRYKEDIPSDFEVIGIFMDIICKGRSLSEKQFGWLSRVVDRNKSKIHGALKEVYGNEVDLNSLNYGKINLQSLFDEQEGS